MLGLAWPKMLSASPACLIKSLNFCHAGKNQKFKPDLFCPLKEKNNIGDWGGGGEGGSMPNIYIGRHNYTKKPANATVSKTTDAIYPVVPRTKT